jgi:predicted nucleic acid-binding protein
MKILVDTSVWSLALRRREPDNAAEDLEDLILSSMAVMIGPVRQELLSGISDEKSFERLRAKLTAFTDLPITTIDYEIAARFFNICRKHGIQGSHTDFLICAVAYINDLWIFTTDDDFTLYARHLPIRLYQTKKE